MSWLSNIKRFFNQVDQLRSIQVTIDENGEFIVGECILANKKGAVVFIGKEELEAEKMAKLPIVLTIEGKGVLHKSVMQQLEKGSVSAVYPSIKVEEFYVQELLGEKHSHVAIIRNSLLEHVLAELNIKESSLLNVFLGAYVVNELITLNDFPTSIVSAGKKYTFEQEVGELHAISTEQESFSTNNSILGYSVKSKKSLAFLGGLYYLFYGFGAPAGGANFLLQNENFKAQKQFKIVGISALVFFLSLLLLIYGALSVLNGEINELTNKNIQKASQLDQLNELEAQLKEKKEFIAALGLQQKENHAYLLDQIGQTVPSSIQLNTLLLNPNVKAVKQGKEIEYNHGVVSITGLSKKSLVLNNWKKELGALKWVEKVSLQDYYINKEGQGAFKLELEYR